MIGVCLSWPLFFSVLHRLLGASADIRIWTHLANQKHRIAICIAELTMTRARQGTDIDMDPECGKFDIWGSQENWK